MSGRRRGNYSQRIHLVFSTRHRNVVIIRVVRFNTFLFRSVEFITFWSFVKFWNRKTRNLTKFSRFLFADWEDVEVTIEEVHVGSTHILINKIDDPLGNRFNEGLHATWRTHAGSRNSRRVSGMPREWLIQDSVRRWIRLRNEKNKKKMFHRNVTEIVQCFKNNEI